MPPTPWPMALACGGPGVRLAILHGSFLSQLLALARSRRCYAARYWRPGLAGGVMCAMAYGIVIWALGESPMAFVSALRETSVVFAALLGCLVLKESFGRGRLLAATSVTAGVALLHLAG